MDEIEISCDVPPINPTNTKSPLFSIDKLESRGLLHRACSFLVLIQIATVLLNLIATL